MIKANQADRTRRLRDVTETEVGKKERKTERLFLKPRVFKDLPQSCDGAMD